MTISSRAIVLAGSGLLACATAVTAEWSGGQIPRDGACFYRDSAYRGPYFCIGGNDQQDTLPRDVSDNISLKRFAGAE